MKETESIGLCVLFLFCASSFTQGEHDSNSSTLLQNFTIPSTSSPPQRSSTAQPESLSRPTLLTASSEGDNRAAADLSANDTLSRNDTANSTEAPGFPPGVAGPTVTTLAPTNGKNAPGNLTDSQDEANLSAGDNQTSTTTTNTTLYTNTTTPLSKGEPKTSTSAPTTPSQNITASTTPRITTSPSATTTQSRGKSSTATTKGTSAPTTITATTTTTQTTEFSSTPVLAKARVDTPSELNVGDITENSNTPMDPLLAGLVSVFVVTAAIVALLIFLKFRHRNERPEFRRLQDLPMDDMMEDTPLSMYSY
ncbi:hypothetical protein QTP70_019890 [Hemibagrus guttatus]|uniref:Uncharacterized protein n=1 Tax=Hemibagrus guttatus TaxID=175788 RepID=A0AAE0Q9X9_9TELE|nr:hypothetical protein QTP70_019890 [Hemibagrus guttatus]KAK3542289.1 hypothetical protein QTP86_021976 [Hemibagrus guttatus]